MEAIDDHPEVIIKWLETDEGLAWSRSSHTPLGILVSVKEDAPEEFNGWGVSVDNEYESVFLWFVMDLDLTDA